MSYHIDYIYVLGDPDKISDFQEHAKSILGKSKKLDLKISNIRQITTGQMVIFV